MMIFENLVLFIPWIALGIVTNVAFLYIRNFVFGLSLKDENINSRMNRREYLEKVYWDSTLYRPEFFKIVFPFACVLDVLLTLKSYYFWSRENQDKDGLDYMIAELEELLAND